VPDKTPCCARSPFEFSARDWWTIIRRTWQEIHHDNVTIVAAGVAFFTLLAIFPMITACLSIYGMFADPGQVQGLMKSVNSVLPAQAWGILQRQITAVITAPNAGLGLGIAISLLVALWSAGAGIRAIMRAMNIAYGETEKRNLVTFYGIASSMTLAVILFVWLSLAVIIGVPAFLAVMKLEGLTVGISRAIPWLLLISVFAFSSGVLYRFGPSRRPAKKRWVMPGIIFTTVTWLLQSFAFSKFIAAFGNYNAVYGSLSAVIILLIWFWLTAYTVIVGAELNAEMERHTTIDTTRGPDRPIGARGAAMADYRHEGYELHELEQSG
jgi:membrane protein